jgi:hypothetical protein
MHTTSSRIAVYTPTGACWRIVLAPMLWATCLKAHMRMRLISVPRTPLAWYGTKVSSVWPQGLMASTAPRR